MAVFLRILLIATVVFGLTSVDAAAQGNGPGFHAAVFFTGGCRAARNQTVSSPTAPATVGRDTAPCISDTALTAGEAAATTLRAASRSAHECCGTGSGTIRCARIQIENVVPTTVRILPVHSTPMSRSGVLSRRVG
jgi:phage tail tape-measure protein